MSEDGEVQVRRQVCVAGERQCKLKNVRLLKNRIVRMSNGDDDLSNVVRASEAMSGSGR